MKISPYLILSIIVGVLSIALLSVFPIYLNSNINLENIINGSNPFFGQTHPIQPESIPTIVNGLTAVTSVIIGFSGAVLGLVYRQDFTADHRSKATILAYLFYFAIPFTFLLIVYNALIYGALNFALTYALNAVVLALTEFVLSMLAIFYKLDKDKKDISPIPPATTQSSQTAEPSVQNAINKIAEMCRILSADNKQIFMRKAQDVSDDLLKKLSLSFLKCGDLMNEIMHDWMSSKSKGSDAFQTSEDLKERIDIKLYETSKLDFEQMKKIMSRLHRIDDILLLEEIIPSYLEHYIYLCKQKKLEDYAAFAIDFRENFIDRFTTHVINESNRLEHQVERCNLYYQAKLNTTTVRTAYIALVISLLSLFIALASFWVGK